MRVKKLMSKPAITCDESDTLQVAAHLMWTHDCGVIPVVDQDGHLTGIVTDRDICMAAYTQGSPLHWIPLSKVMTKDVHSCRPSDTIEAAEERMTEQQIRRLPVIDSDGRPVGLLSLADLARDAASRRRRSRKSQRVLRTIAATSEARASEAEGEASAEDVSHVAAGAE